MKRRKTASSKNKIANCYRADSDERGALQANQRKQDGHIESFSINSTCGDYSYFTVKLVMGIGLLAGVVVSVAIFVMTAKTKEAKALSNQSHAQAQAHAHAFLLEKRWGNFDGHAEIHDRWSLIKTFNHDVSAFTQGLTYHGGRLVESTGMHGDSDVRIYSYEDPDFDSSSLTLLKRFEMPSQFFGEGLCLFQDSNGEERYLQLTWQEQTAFVYDLDLNVVQNFNYTTKTNEGWGITFDQSQMIFYVSDGSDTIAVWDLQFKPIRKMRVTIMLRNQQHNKYPYLNLINELEWDPNDGTILANIWGQNALVRIHPYTGQVLEAFDFTQLYTNRSPGSDVMNGIAHYRRNQWWLTGKYWPYLYLVEFGDSK